MSKQIPASATPGPVLFTVYLFSCQCGTVPLADAAHGSARDCWEAAARHVRLNPSHAQHVRTVRDVSPIPIPARLPDVAAAFELVTGQDK